MLKFNKIETKTNAKNGPLEGSSRPAAIGLIAGRWRILIRSDTPTIWSDRSIGRWAEVKGKIKLKQKFTSPKWRHLTTLLTMGADLRPPSMTLRPAHLFQRVHLFIDLFFCRGNVIPTGFVRRKNEFNGNFMENPPQKRR